MLEFFRYLYYRLYSWNLKKWGESDMPQYNALLGITFMMALNLLFCIYLLEVVGICELFGGEKDFFKWAMMTVFGILSLINYSWLVRDRQYLKLPKRYEGESKLQRRRKVIILWLYVIVSFGSILAEAEVLRRLNGS